MSSVSKQRSYLDEAVYVEQLGCEEFAGDVGTQFSSLPHMEFIALQLVTRALICGGPGVSMSERSVFTLDWTIIPCGPPCTTRLPLFFKLVLGFRSRF